MTNFSINEYKSLFLEPLRIVEPISWIKHIPFAFFIIELLKPKIVVELGVHTGNSFSAFCQAVKYLNIKASCYGVDTFKGDPHSGVYDEFVYIDINNYITENYGDFAQLMRMTFDEALEYFSDGSIDLLHIDGYHTYEAVKHDFESWLPKMSDRGVILLHDTQVRRDEFGAWKLWEEISKLYPSYEFKFGYGLGVLAVGKNAHDVIIKFIEEAREKIFIERLFFTFGSNIEFRTHIQRLEGEVAEVRNTIAQKDERVRELEANLEDRNQRIQRLEGEVREIKMKNLRINTELNSIKSSVTWRTVMKWHSFVEKLMPPLTRRRRWYELGIIGLRTIANEGWGSFWWKFKNYVKTSKVKEHDVILARSEERFCVKPSDFRPIGKAKIAVVIHAYYLDIFGEICSYLKNIPLKYSLLISVKNAKDEAIVAEQIKYLPLVQRNEIRVVENRGRNIAAMLVDFAPLLRQFDYICHLHTKKSLYSGREQTEWRQYLYDMLLGSSERIKAILSAFEMHPSIGIIYPETFRKLPYWTHSWLANKHIALPLLNRLGVRFDPDEYIDFPVGSMFWARREALEPLLDLRLTHRDFPEEHGQTDGTLHHTIERCFVIAAQSRGFRYAVILDKKQHIFCYHSKRNFEQYLSLPFESKLRAVLASVAIVSFDIFDTILSRPFATPDMVFKYIEEQVTKKHGIKNFYALRKESEHAVRARKDFHGDVKISEIYSVLAGIAKISTETANKLMELEVNTETKLLVPRKSVIEQAKEVMNSGKRLILVSDTYLERKHIEKILSVKDIDFFDELYISCEIGKRKDRGDLWEYILEREKISKDQLLHVGDNEQSDVQILVDYGFRNPVHIMKPSVLFRHSKLGEILYRTIKPFNGWRENLLYGLIANSYCLDPNPKGLFESEEPLSNPYAFGYTVFGPIIFSFLSWLIRTSLKDRVGHLKFITREGYLLNRAYEIISKHPSIVDSDLVLPQGSYFLCSRSAVLFASIRTEEDVPPLLERRFNGTLWDFFSKRLGVIDMKAIEYRLSANALKQFVSLPRDYGQILKSITKVFDILVEQAEHARETLLQYCAEQGIKETNTIGLVDLGYSGTIQKVLNHLLQQSLAGYYFVTDYIAKTLLSTGAVCRAYFGEFIDPSRSALPIYRYSLLIESVLTSPDGQLIYFSRTPKGIIPCYKEPGISQKEFPTIQRIHEGILKFINEMLDLFGVEALDIEFPKAILMRIYEMIITGELQIGSLKSVLSVEDDFCGNAEIPVLDWYAKKINTHENCEVRGEKYI